MTSRKRTRNMLTGGMLLVGWVGLMYVVVSPGADSDSDISLFSVELVVIINLILATGVSTGLLIMRLFKVSKAQLGIPYIFLGMLNLASASICLVMLSVTELNQLALICAISLMNGIIICVDIYIKGKPTS